MRALPAESVCVKSCCDGPAARGRADDVEMQRNCLSRRLAPLAASNDEGIIFKLDANSPFAALTVADADLFGMFSEKCQIGLLGMWNDRMEDINEAACMHGC